METKKMEVEVFEAIDNENLELLRGGKTQILKVECEANKSGDGALIGKCCNGKEEEKEQ